MRTFVSQVTPPPAENTCSNLLIGDEAGERHKAECIRVLSSPGAQFGVDAGVPLDERVPVHQVSFTKKLSPA